MVVDDQYLLLMHTQFTLEDAGYQVVQANSADEALNILEEHPGIAAIFTDVVMPGSLDGAALAEQVRRTHPHVTIIVTSGAPGYDPGGLPTDVRFLPKPYTGQEVIRLIGEATPRSGFCQAAFA
ncbi:response regulator [Sphingomonas sp.]|uniref:response regulator n=1 Tax=Sphingomonas sp. TaxID=28214 RepID=UPI0028A017EF|nr:response regulator [Sphingomonas sp.]